MSGRKNCVVISDEIISCVCKKCVGTRGDWLPAVFFMPHLIILCKEKGTPGRKFNNSKEISCSYRVTCFCVEESNNLVFWLFELFGFVNKINLFLALAIIIIIITIIVIVVVIIIIIIMIITSLVFNHYRCSLGAVCEHKPRYEEKESVTIILITLKKNQPKLCIANPECLQIV
jgi:hypothetical protein